MEELIVLGSGPAGLTAALYAARGGVATAVWEGPMPGGLLTETPAIENFPGFPGGIGGFDLIMRMREQAEGFGVRFVGKSAAKVEARSGGGAVVTAEDGETVECRCLVVATGARHRKLGIPGEEELAGKGVSYCATCDGAFFRGKRVAVVGGGDTACEEALFLTKFAREVLLVHRRGTLRAGQVLARRVAENGKIRVVWWRAPEEVVAGADGKVSGLRVRDVSAEGGGSEVLAVDGVFVAVGVTPASEAVRGVAELDEGGYVRGDGVRTAHEGIFVAGDVADARYRQAVSAAGTGCRAGIEAVRYLQEKGAEGGVS